MKIYTCRCYEIQVFTRVTLLDNGLAYWCDAHHLHPLLKANIMFQNNVKAR